MIPRIYENLEDYLKPNKALIIYGPRRIGKTTLLQNFLKQTALRYRLDSGDNLKMQHLLGSQDFDQILAYAQGYELIVIDEAQNIPHIGQGLKILVDQVPNLKIIATGSSSFELADQIGEPLTGRKKTLCLYPISQIELNRQKNRFELKEDLEDRLIFGSYPEVITASTQSEKMEILNELVNSYLLKDILTLERVKGSQVLLKLLRLLAFQVGSEVSIHELSQQLGIDVKTADRYLDLFEKAFVIVRVGGLSRNLRKEISKKNKFYFLDNGIRNAIIANFNLLETRNDQGALWENFLFCERLKKRDYTGVFANIYFWRTYDQKEVDLVEEKEGKLFGFEFKWSSKKKSAPKDWLKAYPEATYLVVTPENYLDFIL